MKKIEKRQRRAYDVLHPRTATPGFTRAVASGPHAARRPARRGLSAGRSGCPSGLSRLRSALRAWRLHILQQRPTLVNASYMMLLLIASLGCCE